MIIYTEKCFFLCNKKMSSFLYNIKSHVLSKYNNIFVITLNWITYNIYRHGGIIVSHDIPSSLQLLTERERNAYMLFTPRHACSNTLAIYTGDH